MNFKDSTMIIICFSCEVILQIICYAHVCDNASHIYKDLRSMRYDITLLSQKHNVGNC